jgi:pimeloyl-ACP methyl ester carboxylesterase
MTFLIGRLINAVDVVAPWLAGRAAFRLFSRPRTRGKVRPAERDVHERAFIDSLTVNGNEVAVYRWGSGERPVLLLHGWESRGSRFAAFVPALEALGLSPIAFDAPGHGQSGGNGTTILEYHAIVERLQEQFGAFHAIVAHSFGATCAFHALRRGVAADRLVAISGLSEFEYLVDEFCRRLGLRPRLKRDLRRRIERFLAPETEIWARFSVPYDAAAVRTPLLVIHDEHDDVVGLTHAQRIAAAYPQTATLVTTRGLGHRRIMSEPAVVSATAEFLAAGARPDVVAA